jgi:nitrite reductase/ring-hydroxylating ferredoxin subunit
MLRYAATNPDRHFLS